MTIRELLEAHEPTKYMNRKEEFCSCKHLTPLPQSYRAHLAEVLKVHQREAKAEALEQAAKDLTHPMHGIIVCDEYCANRSCPDCIRIRAAKDAADWLKQRAGTVREGL